MMQNMHEQEANYILESKRRCKEIGMDPDAVATPKTTMSNLQMIKKREEYKEILEVVRFFGNKILNSLEGTPVLIAISDEKGYLLDTLGDKTIVETMKQLGIKTGVQLNEEEMGTNVVSLTLNQNKPVQIIGKEHYHTHLYNTACYGVPFHYSDENNLLGSICIMTAEILHNPFFLMTLTTVVDAIERELLLRKQNREINKQKELLYKSEKKHRELLERDLIMKDEFITLITHEFKTPINVIYSAIQLIEYIHIKKIPKEVKKLIGSIKRNTFRQLRLVNNLLDITRLKSNQFKINEEELDIVSYSRLITESIRTYADQKKINLQFKSGICSLHTIIDDEKYERIMLNILSNAIKFTPEGGNITVTVKENIKNRTASVSIMDNGIGIPKEKHKMIFEKFGQVDSNLSRQAEGTGIGLALVKMLIKVLDGEIQVDSEENLGSTFTVIIPIKEGKFIEKNEAFLDTDSRLINSINVEFSDIYF